jgi:hypothetical protein
MADATAAASSSRGGGETTRRVLFGNLEMVRIDFAGFPEFELEWCIVVTELGSLFLFMFFLSVAAIALTLN